MSPEQAAGEVQDVDTRSDVFSLGILLYELLTGSTPIEKQSIREQAFPQILAAFVNGETPRPSSRLSSLGKSATEISQLRKTDPRKLGRTLKGDLDWIAVKALDKDRDRRYGTANALADDVQRFIDGATVLARPPSLWYQFQKFRKQQGRAIDVTIAALSIIFYLEQCLLFRPDGLLGRMRSS